MMGEQLMKSALQQGLGYALFVCLLIYIMKKQEQRDVKCEEREKNYQSIIEKLTEKFNLIEDIQKDVTEIKDEVKQLFLNK